MTYRVSSVAVLLAFGLSLGVGIWFPATPGAPTPPQLLAEGEVRFDLCSMWEQIPVIPKVAALVWFASAIYLIVMGLMNRAAARWVPIMSLISLFLWEQHSFWRFTRCMSLPQQIAETVFAAAFAWMCLHQLIQRRPCPFAGTVNSISAS